MIRLTIHPLGGPHMNRQKRPNGGTGAYRAGVALLGLYQVVLASTLVVALFMLWPEPTSDRLNWLPTVRFLPPAFSLSDDARLILIVLCTGALGSYVHATTSFVSYVGNRRLVFSWAWWYLLRPFLGMALALIFYFVLRGGLLTTSAEPSKMSPFGIAAVAGLVGMFSKQATDKLRELFDNLFKTEMGQGDDARADKLGANVPVAEAMIDRRKIAAFVIPDGKEAKHVLIVELHKLLGGVVTRIPVLDHNDVLQCVIHQSLLYKFLADRSIEAVAKQEAFDAKKFSLQDFLELPSMKALVQDSMAFVPAGAMLSEAKELMERTPNCQDVFVTEHGLPNEPVQGWLTDAELLRAAKA